MPASSIPTNTARSGFPEPSGSRGNGPAASLRATATVVVYDSDPNELASSHAAAVLIRQGYRAVTLKGGIAEWLAANLPIETKEAPKMATPEPGALKG